MPIFSPRQLFLRTITPSKDNSSSSLSSTITKSSLKKSQKLCDSLTRCEFKQVSFLSTPEIIPRDDYCDDRETRDRWFTKREIERIRATASKIVIMKKEGRFQESDNHTFFGLHRVFARDEITFIREECSDAVMAEQANQRLKGRPADPERISQAYRRAVERSHPWFL